MRIIEKFNRTTDQWEVIDFGNLDEGDIFRIYDNGERYINTADGNNVWISTSKPYLTEDCIFTIDTIY